MFLYRRPSTTTSIITPALNSDSLPRPRPRPLPPGRQACVRTRRLAAESPARFQRTAPPLAKRRRETCGDTMTEKNGRPHNTEQSTTLRKDRASTKTHRGRPVCGDGKAVGGGLTESLPAFSHTDSHSSSPLNLSSWVHGPTRSAWQLVDR